MAAAPLGGHALHAIPILIPVVATAVVLLPDQVRRWWRAGTRVRSPRSTALVVAAVASGAAGLVHAVVMPEHFKESLLFGVFFLVAFLGQELYALFLLLRPSRPLLEVGAVCNLALVALWLVSRTVGVPLGPDPGVPEPVGPLDLVAVTTELAMITAALFVLGRSRPRRHATA